MLKEPQASLLATNIIDYCQACPGYEAQRFAASIRRLASDHSPADVDEISQRIREQLGLSDRSTAGAVPAIVCEASGIS